MKILAIDTSCDDTCIAIVEVRGRKKPQFKILANVVSSQIKIHQKYGGVYPALAKREHQRNLIPVLKEALKKAKLLKEGKGLKSKSEKHILTLKEILEREKYLFQKVKSFLKRYQKPAIDLMAVTVGPGLEPCLWQGVNFARALSFFWEIPIVPINHIEAHIFANFLDKEFKADLFPAICLVVSGGHTQLILMKDFGKYKILGETRDDAAGECFDKTARILGLEYPGGPAIAEQALQFSLKNKRQKLPPLHLPRPMLYSKNYDFSFSGLKTAVLYHHQECSLKKSKIYIQAMAKEIQQAIIDVLIKKTIKALKDYRAKTIILGGGVASNDELRREFRLNILNLKFQVNFLVPAKNLCTDNAVMVAGAGYWNFIKRGAKNYKEIKVNANLRIS